MATTQVILKEKIASLGAEGDIVKVRTGYARNFLLPKAKAYEATAGNLRHQANLQKVRAEREAKELEEAEKIASKLKKLKIKLTLATGQGGKAFGSITTKDIVEAVAASTAKITLDRHQLELEKPIKSTGTFEVPVKLHAGVECFLKVTVAAAEAGAEEGAEGEEEAAE
ncbi:large subunit ribosomal protein L9 [Roseimicrobium gellanilyticum]|uniref:Large ribosomal subunit protein bL9 n=1 Tax=Roseimicrobium gellanilyticum TaxID=748857 RepID=A0A366HMH1_9BACT|nr:50S ribosomal protein L9 [Roseimicrobium gellanilyticum]RBP44337.1 large subunit ribosomal protein L9 [Roseimicrobium gellanilyticum]